MKARNSQEQLKEVLLNIEKATQQTQAFLKQIQARLEQLINEQMKHNTKINSAQLTQIVLLALDGQKNSHWSKQQLEKVARNLDNELNKFVQLNQKQRAGKTERLSSNAGIIEPQEEAQDQPRRPAPRRK